MDVPKHLQDKLAQYQNLQNQLQMVAMQKQQLMLQGSDLENAKRELDAAGDGKVYRMAGPILLECGKEAGLKFVTDERDMTGAKTAVMDKQEKKLVDKLNEMKADLQAAMSPPKGN
jgi:prefoldin beta subunit